jgi:glycosyltransferase involved in cell wall biosynthesis
MICQIEVERLQILGITINIIHNQENLGFSRNLYNGLSKFESEYLFFMSDDDNLIEVAFAEMLNEIQCSTPDFLYSNFDQHPYGTDNPKIQHTEVFSGSPDYRGVRTLIEWPKMTGIVIRRKSVEYLITDIEDICNNCAYFPHVIISLLLYLRGQVFVKSPIFIARPDDDYLDHLNFVPYVGDYLLGELSYFRSTYDDSNLILEEIGESLRSTRIVDTSLSWLLKESAGQIQISGRIKIILQKNIEDFLLGKRINREGFSLEKASPRLLLKTAKYICSRSLRSVCSRF